MAHARDRRRRRGPRAAARRRGPDPDRASLADDVPPALLARQRHRPRHGHQRDRHRAVGHPRQGPRRPVPQALGRAGARLRAALLPPRRREDGGLLRDRRAEALRRARAPAMVEDGFTAFKSMAVPPTMPLEGLAADPLRGGLRGGDARRGRRGDRHHGRLPCAPEPAHGHAVRQGAGALRPLLVRGAVLAGDDGRHRRDPALGEDADRDRRAARRRARVPRAAREAAPAASSSRTSPTAAA